MGRKITVVKAKKLQKKWWDTRLIVTTNGGEHEDTCQFFYTVEELLTYLEEVKTKSIQQGIDNPGINIWFGAYDATETEPSLATVFLAPTKRVKSDDPDKEYEDVANDEIEPFNGTTGLWPPGEY
ncbi:hypothetical protein JM83_0198 [Gillisia sp. Hel_I_86]|uniref:hypothetical protein n=1 Tax=Gillisia sp. Hel_I_86 TaxID=1249981 RepID=UPI0011999DED|nr:hypothetical protein [Gillisia sp. Hel_I_86]TVZ25296.1 hypothetical protein JM83_0198 [Gillisia sp. Hel_I_86]